jgi:hypothetical protein
MFFTFYLIEFLQVIQLAFDLKNFFKTVTIYKLHKNPIINPHIKIVIVIVFVQVSILIHFNYVLNRIYSSQSVLHFGQL